MRFCILLLTVASALAWPVAFRGDEQQCPPMSDRLFESGSSYLLKYDTSVSTLIQGTSHEVTGMNIDCDVLIEAHSDCMLVLKTEKCNLKNVEGDRLPNNRQFSQSMTEHEVVLRMDNGKLVEMYAHQDEPVHILNIKRGIVSMLQHDLSEETTVSETTVNGNCTSKRVVIDRSKLGRAQEVSISTDLNNCSRPQQKAVTLSPTSFLTSVQIANNFINSTRVCSYELRDDNVKKVNCRESHVFNPFSYDGQRGVMSFVQQELKFKETTKMNSILKLKDTMIKKDLMYEFEEQQQSAAESAVHAAAVLDELVRGSLDEVQFDSARLFGEFVVNLRTLNYPTLKQFFDNVRSQDVEIAKTYMYDALLQCGSIPCFKVMNDLIIDETVPSPISDAIMYVMAFRQYPPLTLIEESLRIAQTHKRQSVLLPLSIMVHNYYIQQEAELQDARRLPDPLKESIRLVRDMLGRDCSIPDEIQGEERIEQNRRILLALKSIGNMGEAVQKFDSDEFYTSEQIVPRLKDCIARKDLHHNTTMAAIQAFRRFNIPSTDEKRVRNALKEVLGDSSRSVHSRIAAYLMIMRSHPSVTDLEAIVEIMLNEPLMQVKAFVFSHIENVLESEEPLVQDLKRKFIAAMGNRQLPEYPKDPLRYSRNIEKSKAITVPYLNKTMATQLESNIIFNPEHYLPHHVMLNTTINVLGQSWNLFEAGAEMQGFEPALEAFFGPMGYYPDDILGSLFKNMDTTILSKIWEAYTFLVEEAKITIEELRSTPWADMNELLLAKLREAKQTILDKFSLTRPTGMPATESPMTEHMNEILRQALPAEFEDKLNRIHNMIPQEPQMPHASVYIKMLGNELGYVSLEDIKSIIPKLNFSVENIKTVAKKYAQELMDNVADGIEKNITKSFIFLERDFIIPTSAGLPLNCSVNGTAVLSLRMRAALGFEPMTMKAYASGRISPSASVEVIGTMGVNVPILGEAAVLANATAYHASHIEGNVTLNGAHLKLNLNNTDRPMNLFNFSTNYFLIKPDSGIQWIPGVQQDRVEVKKCVGVTKQVLGVDLCVAWAYPNASYVDMAPRFPITGPSSFNITLDNTDKALKTYTLEFQYKMLKKGGSPAKKTLSMIAKRKPSQHPAEITDVILVNFTAPGEELTREISSLITFNRAKYEAKWNFSIPELQTYAFAGLLNLKDPSTFTSGFHLVANATSGPDYKASISTTLKNVTTLEKTNYTAVFNASVMDLYFANVAQYVSTANNWRASATNYYYWDDETPLYQQILFPKYGYTINHEKYRQNTALIEYNKQDLSAESRISDSRILLSVFEQNLQATSHIERHQDNYNNDMELKFNNSLLDISILNSTVSSVDTILDQTHTQKDLKISLIRHNKAIVYDHQMIFSPKELNNTITLGYETTEKVLKPGFELYKDWSFMKLYGDRAFATTTISYNVSTELCLRNETVDASEPTPAIYMAYLNVSLPRPYSEERLTFSVSGRVANETPLANNYFSYWTQFNTTVPSLKFKTTTQGAILSSEKDFIIHLNDTTMTLDEQPLLVLDSDLVSNTDNGNYYSFRILTPVYNYTFNVTLHQDEVKGWVVGYNTTHNNTYTDLLNMTQTANMTFSRDALSLNAMLYHPWLQATTTNVLTPSGPIRDFRLVHIKEFAVDAYDKTKELNWEGLKQMTTNVVNSVRSSRLELINTVHAKTPSLVNLTLDNSFAVDGNLIYNVFEFEVNRSKCGSGLRVNTSVLLNEEGWRSGLSYRVKGRRMPEVTGNHTISILRVDPSNLGVDVQNDFLFGSRLANLTVNGDFKITRMNRPWRFEGITGGLKHNLTSPLMNSSMDSGVHFDNFVNLNNFNAIDSFFMHNATSKWANSTLVTGMKFDGFRSLFNFDDITTRLNHSFNSTLTNWTTGANFNLKNVRSLFEFERLDAGAMYNMTSRWSNISTGAVYVMEGFRSLFNFNLIDGRVTHNITSPWSVMTTGGLLQLSNFRSLFDFDSIHASGENKMSSCLTNWTNDAIIDFTNFRSLFNFDRIYLQAGNRMNTTMANSTNTGRFEISNVRSLFNFDEVRSSAVHNTNTTWGNWSAGVGMDLVSFQSLFEFQDAVFGAKHDLKSLWYNTTTESELSLHQMRSPFNFQKVMGVVEHSTNTSLGNWTTYSGISLNEFQSIFNFRSIDAALGHRIDSRWVNWTTDYSMILDDVRSLTQFTNANSGFSTVLHTKWGNMTTNTGVEFAEFRSLMDFDKITAFYHTFVNTSILNATHVFDNEITNSRGLFNFDRASSKMATNVTSILGNVELYNGIELDNFESLMRFAKINHTLTANVTARYINATTLSNLILQNSYGLFNFEKFNYDGKSLVQSRLMNVTEHRALKLNNFASLKKFESVSLDTLTNITTPITVMNLTQFYGLYNMRDVLSFEKANATIVYEGKGPLGELKLKHDQVIDNMSGLFQIEFTNLTQEANMTSRFFNLTAVHSQVTNQMNGLYNFERINGSVNYNLSSPVGTLTAYASSDLNDFRKLFNFRLVNNTGLLNFTSRYMNLTHIGNLEFNNFRSMFEFDLINGSTSTNFSSLIGKVATASAAEFNDFRSLYNFALVRANNTVNVSSAMLNVTTEHGVEMNNFRKMFNFDRVNASSRVNVSTPLGVVGNVAELGFHNFRSLFNFERINFTNSANASSRYVNGTSQTDVEFNNFTRILTFERIIATTNNNLSTPFFNTTGQAGIEMHNFSSLFNFSRVNASVLAALKSRFINSSGEAAVEFHNSSKLFTFERINATAKANVSTPFINTTAMGYIGFHNFSSLLNFSRINSTIEANVTSQLANLTTSGSMELRNMSGFNKYELLNGTTRANFTSRLVNMTSATNMEITNMTGFARFLRMINNASLNITSKLANLTTAVNSEVNNMTGLMMYDRMLSNASLNFTSKLANLTAGTGMEVNNMTGLMVYDRIFTNGSLNFTSCLAKLNSSASMEINNMTGFSRFHRIIANASLNVTSKLANLTTGSNMLIRNMTGVGQFEHIMGNVSLNFTSRLANLTTLHTLEMNNFTSLITFQKINATSSVNASTLIGDVIVKGGVEAHNINTLLTFDRINGSFSTVANSLLANLNVNADFGLHEFTNLTHFERANATLVWDLVSDYFTAGQNSSITLSQFRGVRVFNSIIGNTWIFFNSPMYATGIRTTLDVDNAFNFFQEAEMFSDLILMGNKYQLITRQSSDNEHLLFNVTIPSRGSLCLDNYLNAVGDEFIMTLFHQMEDVKTVDLTWLLKLNNTGVIYSNVSWNPETVQAIKEFNENVYMNLLKMARNISNSTQSYLEKALNQTYVVFNQTLEIANNTIRLLNYTYYNPREAYETFREREEVKELEKKLNDSIQKVKDYLQEVNDTLRDIVSRMDFTTVDSTIQSFKSLREVQRFQRKLREAIDRYSEVFNTKYDEALEKINEIVDEIILISKDPENPINALLLECLDMTMNDVATKSYDLTLEYGNIAYERSLMYGRLAKNFTLYSAEWALNNTKNITEWAIYEVGNYTILVYNKTVNFSKCALEYALNYTDTIKNVSLIVLDYANYYKDWAVNQTELIVDISRPYVIWMIEYSEPYRVNAMAYAKQLVKDTTKKMVIVFKRTVELGKSTIKYAKKGYRMGKQYATDISVRIVEISKDPEHFVNRVLMERFTDRTLYEVAEDGYNRISSFTDEWYRKAEQMYLDYYYRIEELYRTYYYRVEELYQDYYLKLEEFVLETMTKLETFSMEEDHLLNTYMRQYFDKNLYEVYLLANEQWTSLRSEAEVMKTEFMQWLKRVRTQPLQVTKDEIKLYLQGKYEKAQELVEEFLAREDVAQVLEKVRASLRWMNQTRFQPLEQTVEEVKLIVEETRDMALDFIEELKQREEYTKLVQMFNDFLAREDVSKTIDVIKQVLQWANQTRFQPLEETIEQIRFVLEENYYIIQDMILTFPVESNVRKMVEIAKIWANETEVFLNKTYNVTMETYYLVKDLAEEKYLLVKEIAEEKYLLVKEYTLEQWRYLKEETPYVEKAKELIEKTRVYVEDKIDFTKEYAVLVRDLTVSTTKDVITYVNGTMAGWAIRYYELDQLPFRAFDRYVTFVYGTKDTITYIVRVAIDEIPYIIDNGLLIIDNGLNTVGRVGEHSYAMNISHPLSWASFRETPDLTEEQWRIVIQTKDMIEENIIEPSITKIKEWLQIANETQREIRTYIKEVYDTNKPIVEGRLEELKQKILELKQNISEEYKKLPTLEQLRNFDQLAEKYPILLEIKANLTDLKEKIQDKIPTVEELKDKWTELKQTVKDYIPTMEEIEGNWTILRQNIEGNWTMLRGNLEEKWILWSDYIQGNYTLLKDTITERYPIWKENTIEFLRNVTNKMEEIYQLVLTEYPNAREHAVRFIEFIKNKTLEIRDELETRLPILYEKTKELAQEYYDFVQEQYPVYLEKTKVTAQEWIDYIREQYPIYMERANELVQEWIDYVEERYPTYVQKLRDWAEEIRNMIEAEYPQYREKIEQGIEKIKEFFEYLKTLPRMIPTDQILALRYYRPFSSESTAMVFDDLHILTFDSHLYEHPGYVDPECTYVMATDYIDNNFTLFSNQYNMFLALKGVHMKISRGNEVFFNGEEIPKNIPFQSADKSVTIVHDGPWVNVTSTYGIKLFCNSERFLCTISLSSWYHGKTRGLLGNLDREARTDRIKPNGENATSLIDFINAYETTDRPQCQITRYNHPASDILGCNEENRNILKAQCAEYFSEDNSPLQAAFEMLSPTEWKQECISHAEECRDICALTFGYVELARSKNIGIIDPCEQCVDRPRDSIWIESKVVYGADIIFTISENERFRGPEMMRNLKSLANKLEKTLSKSPLTDNRYGLAAFGGIDVHEGAHSHSIHGQLINRANRMSEGLDSLEFNGTYPTDAFDAVKLASDYKFRPGAAKVIILIVESERQYENSRYNLTEIQRYLTSRGIVLYVVSDYESLQKKSYSGAPVGIQYDNTIISAKKDAKDSKITKFLDIPTGNYAKLAIATRGSIFRLDMLRAGSEDLLTMLPKTVRNDAVPIMAGEVQRQCTCVINPYGLATIECQNLWI
ncbi:uncharacterized protein LOC119723087 [Patiria miniata]|uniref:Vitellogenin domain-containing protein n=1 Tax=Patiria miniata TaxID=46514 RepID=A0A913ZCL6_PATMI|nr:uncharacterized protein LOC119723087 [Patiria miniata]